MPHFCTQMQKECSFKTVFRLQMFKNSEYTKKIRIMQTSLFFYP